MRGGLSQSSGLICETVNSVDQGNFTFVRKSQGISEISGCGNYAVVENVDNAIREINLCLIDNSIGFPDTYPLGSGLSSG